MQFINYILNRRGGSGASVQSGEIILTPGNQTVQDTISAIVLNKSFMLFSYKSGNPNQDPIENFVRGKILNTTTLEFKINANAVQNIEIRWFVVEFPPASSVTVQHSGDLNVNTTPFNQSITSVSVPNSFPIVSFSNNDTAWDDSQPLDAQLTSATNLQFTAGSAISTIANWQVVENMAWNVSVYTDSMAASDTVESTPIAAVDLTDTFMLVTGKNTDGTFCLGDAYPKHFFNSTTEIQAFRISSSGPALDITYQVIKTNGQVIVQNYAGQQILGGGNNVNTTVWPITPANTVLVQNNLCTSVCLNLTNTSIDADDVYVLHEIINSTTLNHRRWSSNAITIDFAFAVLDFS